MHYTGECMGAFFFYRYSAAKSEIPLYVLAGYANKLGEVEAGKAGRMANVSPPRSVSPPFHVFLSSDPLELPGKKGMRDFEAEITCVSIENTRVLPLKAQFNVERLVSPSSLRSCSLENGAERYTPHSNSIEPPILLIGWTQTGLRAADWSL